MDRFHGIYFIERKTTRRVHVVRRGLTERLATSSPDHLWSEIWRSMSRNFKLKEKQNWLGEKPKLDDARRLRGIYFIDLEDIEFNKTIKDARKKLEVPIVPCPAV